MRISPRLLAVPSGVGTQASGLRPVPHALLPPIPLYRRVLRAHRKFLPPEMRVLGDEYVKAEFHTHKTTENPIHIIGFLTEWQNYAQQIEGDNWLGERMEKSKIDKMSGRLTSTSMRSCVFVAVRTGRGLGRGWLDVIMLFEHVIRLKRTACNEARWYRDREPPADFRHFAGTKDQQIGQMYELMNAIRKKELEENDPEYVPDPPKQ